MDKIPNYSITQALLRNYNAGYNQNKHETTFNSFTSIKRNSYSDFNKIINADDLAQEILNFLTNSHNIKEMNIVHIDSDSHLTKNSKQNIKDQDLRLFSLSNLVSDININKTKQAVAVDDISIDQQDNNIAYEIVVLLAMMKLKVYFLKDFSMTDKKLFNKVLNSIINIFQAKNVFLNNSDSNTNNKPTEIVSTIENIADNKKSFALITDILQKKIDFSHDSNAMQFLNIVKNIPKLKELTLSTLIKRIQKNDSPNTTANDKYNAIYDLVNNTPIDNWLQEDKNIDLQTLAKRSMEFIMFSTLAQQQMQGDTSNSIKSDEFYLYLLLHVASKKIDYYMADFKKFIAENKIDKLLEKPVKFIETFENIIEEIRKEIKLNILSIKPATNINTDHTIDKVVNDNVTRTVGASVKLNPIILTIPDHPIIIREISKNKKTTKRGYGENRCPCGSGKKLKDCCGKKRDKEE
jgi:hypothetical protein